MFISDRERQLHIEWLAEAVIDAHGVARYGEGRNVATDEVLASWIEAGAQGIDLDACSAARDADTAAFLAEYIARDRGPSDEDMAEMRANFEPGSVVVNVITGRRIQL